MNYNDTPKRSGDRQSGGRRSAQRGAPGVRPAPSSGAPKYSSRRPAGYSSSASRYDYREPGYRRTHAPGAGIRHQRRRSAPRWTGILLAVCALVLVGLGCVGASQVAGYMDYMDKCRLLEQDTFFEGITVDGQPLDGMTLDEAIARFSGQLSSVASSTQISVTALGNTYTLDSGSVELSSDIQTTLGKAYSLGRSGSFEERLAQVEQLAANGMDFTLGRGWNEELLRQKISDIADDVYVQVKNATVESFDPDSGEFTFSSEVTGYVLDEENLYSQITQAVASGNVTAAIEAKVDVVEPEYGLGYMQAHFGRISAMTTETTSNSNRNNNIKLASACFDGLRVDPGETVSFNDTTGPRSEDKGYKPAGAYSGGVLIEEPGGGVCQVSTTLYNAVVKADLEIVERSPHSRPVGYVDIGLDATVDYNNQDFRFKNNTDFPIFIVAEYYDQTLTFKIYGHQLKDGIYIMTEGELVETLPALDTVTERDDPSLPYGRIEEEPAREGYKAVSYKIYYDANNNEISREVLANSTYRASGTIRRVGTGTG